MKWGRAFDLFLRQKRKKAFMARLDRYGQELSIGDYVIYLDFEITDRGSKDMPKVGKVVRFTDQMVVIHGHCDTVDRFGNRRQEDHIEKDQYHKRYDNYVIRLPLTIEQAKELYLEATKDLAHANRD